MRLLKPIRYLSFLRKYSKKIAQDDDLTNVRNIGILAHIDAGKTTTTERMLYYSGKINSMGEVHKGNTVTDFLDQERERGITISSAAVSFSWRNHKINLIDTPGHIDFTVEVERSLNVLDGAVVILDSSAGVEAQTLTVWRQADHYELPRIVYLNKMDRPNASLKLCLNTLQNKLGIRPLLLHLPVYDVEEKFVGVVDLITMKKLVWEKGDGRGITISDMGEDQNPGQVWEEANEMRKKLIDTIADYDDTLADHIITSESHEVPPNILSNAVRKTTLSLKAIPIVCGSSYKNIGVQALMDSVILFLPSPKERNKQINFCFGDNLCARAFKVMHDMQKKPVIYFRVYSGSLTKGQKVFNIQQGKNESITKLMIPYADETVETVEVSQGNIAAALGLKNTNTGDFITSNSSVAAEARKKLNKLEEKLSHHDFGYDAEVPNPVFFCSIEAPSQAYQNQLEVALMILQKEDPSLIVFADEANGQTVLGGMGELHLEIIKNRIVSEYKVDVELGPLQIAYQELPKELYRKETHVLENKIGSSLQKVSSTVSLVPISSKGKQLLLDKSPENIQNISSLTPRTIGAIEKGIVRALSHGPVLGYPVVDISVMLHGCEIARGTTESTITAAVTQCVQKLLKSVGTRLREPVMRVEVVTEKDCVSIVLSDLSHRRGITEDINQRGSQEVISALVPLAELLGYAAELRSLTSGKASFSMELNSYQLLSSSEEAKVIKKITGFEP